MPTGKRWKGRFWARQTRLVEPNLRLVLRKRTHYTLPWNCNYAVTNRLAMRYATRNLRMIHFPLELVNNFRELRPLGQQSTTLRDTMRSVQIGTLRKWFMIWLTFVEKSSFIFAMKANSIDNGKGKTFKATRQTNCRNIVLHFKYV